MSMFAFDERYAMFGVTPVENQFILEYMPGARGEYVKVYLYGLIQCLHPQDGMSPERFARELSLSEEEVSAAFRYWERRGLVRRIADHPPVWRYVHPQERMFTDGSEYDHAYADFEADLRRLFGSDRKLHTGEITKAYEWVEQLNLPVEVVLYFLQHRKSTAGSKFSFSAAEKKIMELAEAKIATVAEAEAFLMQESREAEACRKVLRRLGKRRAPSEEEILLYRKWTRDWGYGPEAIEAAVAETTKGEPTFAYLDGILRGIMNRRGSAATAAELHAGLAGDARRAAPLKALLAKLKLHGVTVNEGTLAVYDELRALYPDEVILIAGEECARTGGDLVQVQSLLQAWKDRGLADAAAVKEHIRRHREAGQLVSALYAEWGRKGNPAKSDREAVIRWQEELRLPRELILCCAPLAKDAGKPTEYLNAILKDCAARGITTPEQLAARREALRSGKPAAEPKAAVPAQGYEQRDYEASTVAPDWMLRMFEEMEPHAGQDSAGAADKL